MQKIIKTLFLTLAIASQAVVGYGEVAEEKVPLEAAVSLTKLYENLYRTIEDEQELIGRFEAALEIALSCYAPSLDEDYLESQLAEMRSIKTHLCYLNTDIKPSTILNVDFDFDRENHEASIDAFMYFEGEFYNCVDKIQHIIKETEEYLL